MTSYLIKSFRYTPLVRPSDSYSPTLLHGVYRQCDWSSSNSNHLSSCLETFIDMENRYNNTDSNQVMKLISTVSNNRVLVCLSEGEYWYEPLGFISVFGDEQFSIRGLHRKWGLRREAGSYKGWPIVDSLLLDACRKRIQSAGPKELYIVDSADSRNDIHYSLIANGMVANAHLPKAIANYWSINNNGEKICTQHCYRVTESEWNLPKYRHHRC